MRVLMLSWEYPPSVVGGLGRHVHALSEALAESDTDVTVLTPGNDGGEWEERGKLQVIRVRQHYPAAVNFPETVAQSNISLLQGALHLVSRGAGYDVVHAHDWLTAYAGRAIKHSLGIPLIATIHATEFGRNGGLATDLQRHISDVEWWLAFEAWRIVCCSRAMRDEIQHIFQVPADKIHIIPNGVSPAEGRAEPATRRKYAQDDQWLLFFVGRLVHEKGVDILLRAFQRILSYHPSTVLVVAGKGPEETYLHDLARSLGVDANVRFVGYITDEERNSLYRVADAAVFPSRYEPFGIVALEAMSFDTPVVAAGVGGLAEVIEDGRTGLLFQAGNPGSLAHQVIACLNSPELARTLTSGAGEAIRSRYDWRRIAQRTRSIYAEVAADRSGDLARIHPGRAGADGARQLTVNK